jgi:hypothetical protein
MRLGRPEKRMAAAAGEEGGGGRRQGGLRWPPARWTAVTLSCISIGRNKKKEIEI